MEVRADRTPEPVRVYFSARYSAFKDSIESKDPPLINNRQAGRRNRGRNNGRQNSSNRGSGDNGNRIDSRARGNAPQLLEKYRNMARDAQLAGDRVSTEYYLQFADHYFRVIADNRARQEEQQTRFRRNDDSLDFDDDQGSSSSSSSYDDADGGSSSYNDEAREQHQGNRARRDDRAPRNRPMSDENAESKGRAEPESAVVEAVEMTPQAEAPRRTQRGRKPKQPREEKQIEESAPGLDLAALPPAIARADNDGNESPAAEEAAPRRRGRRPRADNDGDASPAVEEALASEAPAPRRRGRPPRAAVVEDTAEAAE